MLILPDYGKPYIVDSLSTPTVVSHHWIFSGPLMDFVLNPIKYFEEYSEGGAIKVRINNYEFLVPATWHILIADKETCEVDTVPISACAHSDCSAFVFAPNDTRLRLADVRVLDCVEDAAPMIYPLIPKGCALCHPTGPIKFMGKILQLTVVIGPHDLHRFVSKKLSGDILNY